MKEPPHLAATGDASAAAATANAAERTADWRWREFYRHLDLGFIWGRILRDAEGTAVDWRFVDVNPAWGRLTGFAPEEAIGKTVRELIPGVGDEWITEFARVVETREPVHFTRRSGALGRWYDGTTQWAGGDDFTLVLHEVTERIGSEQRRDALLALGDMLRDEDDISSMTRRAAEIVGVVLGVTRAAFGWMHEHRLQVVFETAWALPDAPAIEGAYGFHDHGEITDGLLLGHPLIISDVRHDPRTAAHVAEWLALETLSAVNVPVQSRGRTVAVLIVHDRTPRHWTEDELGFLRNAADRLEIAIARRQAEQRQEIINGEIAHRLKNTLAMVQAVASQTLRRAADDDALDAFMRRLQALGTAHDALMAGSWQATTVAAIVSGVLNNLGAAERFSVEGPDVPVGPRSALSTSLLIHELTTNAMKYGALSRRDGRIAITWRIDGAAERAVALEWIETGGPPVSPPSRKGFGSTLVRLGLAGRGGSTVHYDRSGFRGLFEARVAELARE